MSYRLINSNAIAIKYPEVNEMPCVFANLPDGMNGQFIDAQPERKKGCKIVKSTGHYGYCACDQCGKPVHPEDKFCSNCGADFREEDT